jgi:hypothetical protein
MEKSRCLIILSCAFNPPPRTGYGSGRFTGEDRVNQYMAGLDTFLSGHDRFKNVDIIISDNTSSSFSEIDQRIVDRFPSNSRVFLTKNNQFGGLNIGAGLIFTWLCLENEIKEYDWIIHHEPRQKTRNFNFIDSFLSNPRNLFTINREHGRHFNTGLFCISSKDLLSYCRSINLIEMVKNSISIEDQIFNFFQKEKIQFDTRDEMGLTWYPHGENPRDY